MKGVDTRDSTTSRSQISRIERALRRCLEWSRTGRHIKIITEIDRALPAIGEQPQLAILLSDQGRHPEALDTIDLLPRGAPVPDDLQVFLLGLHANLANRAFAAMTNSQLDDGPIPPPASEPGTVVPFPSR
jgi:hypothetical protein